ncbi:MAG: hypothetical protein CMJ76_01365 [Planctomycetaceae bacterium]|nr:hypothetical protein [Planctomycetaceae bacterium]
MVPRYLIACFTLLALATSAQAQKKLGESTFAHIDTIAADTFQGRLAGSEGGYAAANYITKILADHNVTPAGDGSYFQLFSKVYPNCRNIFGIIEGSDAELSKQLIAVGAHYDHVGFGKNRDSGPIHNGADDNASGTATVLELVKHFSKKKNRLKRSLLICFWDSEEQGLIGSKYWMEHPTVEVSRIVFKVNIDMVGRLDGDTLELQGHRSMHGLEPILDEANQGLEIKLDYVWTMVANSDHWPFINAGIPGFMFHTGLHKEYHKPEDDPETIDVEGLGKVGLLTRRFLTHLGTAETTPQFRKESLTEKQPRN